jgi:hypothetical protein
VSIGAAELGYSRSVWCVEASFIELSELKPSPSSTSSGSAGPSGRASSRGRTSATSATPWRCTTAALTAARRTLVLASGGSPPQHCRRGQKPGGGWRLPCLPRQGAAQPSRRNHLSFHVNPTLWGGLPPSTSIRHSGAGFRLSQPSRRNHLSFHVNPRLWGGLPPGLPPSGRASALCAWAFGLPRGGPGPSGHWSSMLMP